MKHAAPTNARLPPTSSAESGVASWSGSSSSNQDRLRCGPPLLLGTAARRRLRYSQLSQLLRVNCFIIAPGGSAR